MMTFIMVLLVIQYTIFTIILILHLVDEDMEKVLTSKERWIIYGFPFGIYVKLGSMFYKFLLTIPNRWSELPDK